MPRERRPNDSEYYAERTRWVRQGDQFCDVPLSYPFPPDAVELAEGSRRFLSGPFDSGFGMLLSPTCAMAAQGREGEYAHAVLRPSQAPARDARLRQPIRSRRVH